ncbi:unnamed protein product [Calypogeia fissa]
MGGNPSKTIEERLETSAAFQAAVDSTYEECITLSPHKVPGLQAYQLHDAAMRVYEKLAAVEDDDVISKYKEKWLPQPPSQLDVDRTIEKEKLFEAGKQVVSLEDFRVFATTLFKDMGLTTACNRLAVYVPASSLGVIAAHMVVKRLPVVGPAYRGAGPLMPGLLFTSVIAFIIAQLNPS